MAQQIDVSQLVQVTAQAAQAAAQAAAALQKVADRKDHSTVDVAQLISEALQGTSAQLKSPVFHVAIAVLRLACEEHCSGRFPLCHIGFLWGGHCLFLVPPSLLQGQNLEMIAPFCFLFCLS